MRVVITQKLKRLPRLGIAALLVFALFLPLLNARAGAYSLPSQRYIKMSSSATGSIAAGQDVTYELSFITNQSGASSDIGGLVLEFCAGSPIIGDACTAPAGFNTHAFTGDNTLALGTQIGTGGVDFAKDVTNATANRIVLSRSPATTQIATGTTVTIPFGTAAAADGITNPTTTNTTFYARVITFTTTAGAEGYASTNVEATGTAVDAGGFALSTAAQITITAKVPEKLTFCVYTSVTTPNTCSNPTGTAITLGDNNGVLSDQEEFVNKDAQYTVATNALYGVAIRVKGGTLKTSLACPETQGQTCSIDAALPTGGPPGVTPVASAANTEQFGFCTYASAGAGTLTPAAPYNDADCNTTVDNAGDPGNSVAGDAAVAGTAFAFDNDIVNNPNNATVSTYGQIFANKTAGTFSTGVLAFLGNITTTTEPGIYTTTLTFIATGTY